MYLYNDILYMSTCKCQTWPKCNRLNRQIHIDKYYYYFSIMLMSTFWTRYSTTYNMKKKLNLDIYVDAYIYLYL